MREYCSTDKNPVCVRQNRMLELYFIVGRCSELEIVPGQLRTGKGGGVEVEAAMSYLYIEVEI